MIKDMDVDEKTGVATNTYVCDWCGHKFVKKARTAGDGKRGKVSTQIKCEKCSAFIKTWS